jgi:iron complex transport system ATP-binding protein
VTVGVRDLVIGYGSAPVLDGVSLSVAEGELVGLVGPNGVGKTTLIRALLGTLTPDDGCVTLNGDSVADLGSRAASRRVAAVPQQSAVPFSFTVREVVEMGRHPHTPRLGSDPEPGAVERAMQRTEITHLADRDIDAVSGGERQRVLIARALAQDTPALLLDEPTASLDVNHQIRTLGLVEDLADSGRAVLAAIHDLNLAARYCDRLVLLANGGVAARGSPVDVLRPEPLEAAFDTRAVVSRDPVTDAPVVTALPGDESSDDTHVHVVGTGTEAASVVARLCRAGFEVSAGVVPAEGPVETTATHFDSTLVTAPPFAADTSAEREAARELAAEAAVTVGVMSPGLSGSPNGRVLRTGPRRVTVVASETHPETTDVGGRTVPPEEVVAAVRAELVAPSRVAQPGQGT